MTNWKLYVRMMRLNQQLLNLPLFFGILDSNNSLFNPQIVFFVIGFLLSSIFGFFINDYVDSKDTDRYSPDFRATNQSKPDRQIVLNIAASLVLLALIFYTLSGIKMLLLGIIALFLMYIYSAPPLRLKKVKYLDFLDQLFAWLVIPYCAPFILTNYKPFDYSSFVFLTLFLTSAAAIAPILDISADKKVQIFNTTVSWGYHKSLRFAFWTMFLALLVGLYLIARNFYFWYWLMIPPGIIAMGVLGYGLGNVDRPHKIEEIFLRAKKWAKVCGWGMFIFLVALFLFYQKMYY